MVPVPDDPPAQPTSGAPLHVPHHTFGPPRAPRLVLLHGFTQNQHCWGPLPELLGAPGGSVPTRQVVAADAPGHGEAAEFRLSLADAAGPYAAALAGGQRASWLGYSMGGRLALHIALARPDAVGALVLVGASPGIADPTARAQRQADDEALADHLEAVGTAAFVDEWLAQPLFAGLRPDSDQRQARLGNDPAGLASSLRLAGTGAQASLWEALGEITAPTLLVVGEYDTKFRRIAEDMAPLLGGPRELVILGGTGHPCHLEAPEAFSEVVDAWLEGLEGSPQAGTP